LVEGWLRVAYNQLISRFNVHTVPSLEIYNGGFSGLAISVKDGNPDTYIQSLKYLDRPYTYEDEGYWPWDPSTYYDLCYGVSSYMQLQFSLPVSSEPVLIESIDVRARAYLYMRSLNRSYEQVSCELQITSTFGSIYNSYRVYTSGAYQLDTTIIDRHLTPAAPLLILPGQGFTITGVGRIIDAFSGSNEYGGVGGVVYQDSNIFIAVYEVQANGYLGSRDDKIRMIDKAGQIIHPITLNSVDGMPELLRVMKTSAEIKNIRLLTDANDKFNTGIAIHTGKNGLKYIAGLDPGGRYIQ
jgi:hypothetical protein